MRILGIDPGLNITGYGVVSRPENGTGGITRSINNQRPKLEEAGVVRGGAGGELTKRLQKLHQGILDIISVYQPDVVAIEQLYSHYARPRTAILMGHARGVICLAAALHDIPVEHYSATQVKKLLTGSGHAPKLQMQSAIQRELSLSQIPEPADVADALAVALCHYYLGDRIRTTPFVPKN